MNAKCRIKLTLDILHSNFAITLGITVGSLRHILIQSSL